jgi:hypothetical protein
MKQADNRTGASWLLPLTWLRKALMVKVRGVEESAIGRLNAAYSDRS